MSRTISAFPESLRFSPRETMRLFTLGEDALSDTLMWNVSQLLNISIISLYPRDIQSYRHASDSDIEPIFLWLRIFYFPLRILLTYWNTWYFIQLWNLFIATQGSEHHRISSVKQRKVKWHLPRIAFTQTNIFDSHELASRGAPYHEDNTFFRGEVKIQPVIPLFLSNDLYRNVQKQL